MGYRFNTPPNWPAPASPDWLPPAGWKADAAWGPAPDGWNFWVEDPTFAGQPSAAEAPAPVAARKNWFLRHKVITGAGAALLLVMFMGIARGGGTKTVGAAPVADSVATSTTPDQAAIDKAAADKTAADKAAAAKAVADKAAADKAAASTSESASSFKDGVLTTPEMKIEITDHKIIPVGQKGNEYGSKPVIAFWYKITNLTDEKVSPMDWMFDVTAYQDNNPNAENKLDDSIVFNDGLETSLTENIKKGGTVEYGMAYELDDVTTPVVLVASNDLGMTKIGKVTYNLK
jgi:hypothetical protein